MYYSYLLRCADDSLYAGYCKNLEEREAKHNAGKASKYTRVRLPATIVYSEEFLNRTDAMKREAAYKKMSKSEKEALTTKN